MCLFDVHTSLAHTNALSLKRMAASSPAGTFATIEEMDPSVADGFHVIYDREVPFELRLQESAEGPNDVGTLEAIKVGCCVETPQV